ncbi:MAG: hypothetical protein ABIS86_01535 [Streptosporangiaceae bacterium]
MPAPDQVHDTGTAAPARSFLGANSVCLVAAALALVLGGIVWFGLPHEKEISSLWVFLFKLSPFAAAGVAVAWLDLDWARRLKLPLIAPVACFLAFFCFFVPRNFFYALVEQDGTETYYNMLTLVPFVILALSLSYRLGGGSRETSLRLTFGMLLLQLSGLEDLAFLTVNPHTDPAWTPIPEVWTWADHMTVFLGHAASRTEAYVFITVHVVLALLVFFLPARAVTGAAARLARRSPAARETG